MGPVKKLTLWYATYCLHDTLYMETRTPWKTSGQMQIDLCAQIGAQIRAKIQAEKVLM